MIICFDDYELDPERLELRRAGSPLRADLVVVRMLAALARDAGQLVTSAELLSRVWDGRAVSDNVITVTIARLRRLLDHKAGEREFVVNVHGRGYRFVRPICKQDRLLSPVLNVFDAAAPRLAAESGFVGRDELMTRLRTSLHEAVRGAGSVCLISGEPGVGKTRVVEQLAREAKACGLLVAWGHCFETDDAPPLWPFRQLTRELTAQAQGDQPASPHAAHTLATLGEDADCFREKPVAKHQLFEAVLDVFAHVSAVKPCLLILDDLHRADAASLELLRQWVDSIPRSHVLLACTMRTAESRHAAASPDLSYVRGHRNCTRIALERLSESAVTTYVQATLDDPDGRFARAVYLKSEGNPFYMVELARQLLLTKAPDAEALTVPDAALELMRPRLLELDRAAQGVLSCAAVIGATFELATLASVTEQTLAELIPLLDDAVGNELLKVAPDARTIFAFSHELIRRALYEALEPSRRRQLHIRVAGVLEAQHRAGKPVPAATLSHHLHAALPAGDAGETVAACLRAADEATRMFAFADSVGHLRHALEALDLRKEATPSDRMGLLLRQAFDARVSVSPEFEGAVRTVVAVAREHHAGAFMVFAGRLLSFHTGFPPLRGSCTVLEEALSLLGPEDDELRAVTLAHLATTAPLAYDEEASSAQVALARELTARTSSIHARFGVLTAELYLAGGRMHGTSAGEAELAFETFCQQGALPFSAVMLDLHRAVIEMQRNDRRRAIVALARAETQCRALGSRELLWHVERFQVLEQLNVHDDPAVHECLRALHRRAREHAIVGTDLLIAYDEVLALGDDLSPAAILTLCTPDPADPPSVWSMRVRLLAAAGLHDDALHLLRKVRPDRLGALPRDRDHVGTLGALARAALDLDAQDYLEALSPLLAAHADKLAVHVAFHSEGPVSALVTAIDAVLRLDERTVVAVQSSRARRAGAPSQ